MQEKKNCAFWRKIIFIEGNALSHAAKSTIEVIVAMGIKGRRKSWCGHIMVWNILKKRLNEGRQQFN